MGKTRTNEFITNSSGQWWCWAQRIWQDVKKPVMGAAVEMMMASRSDTSARVVVEELPAEK